MNIHEDSDTRPDTRVSEFILPNRSWDIPKL